MTYRQAEPGMKARTLVGAAHAHRTNPLELAAQAAAANRCLVAGCPNPVVAHLTFGLVPVGPVCDTHEPTLVAAIADKLALEGRTDEARRLLEELAAKRRARALANRPPNRATRRARARAAKRARRG